MASNGNPTPTTTGPARGVGADDVADVAALFDRPGPFLSVYLDTEPGVENAAERFEARWRGHAQRLVEHGVPVELVDRVGEQVTAEYASGPSVAVLASAHGEAVTVVGAAELGGDLVTWDSLPVVAPVLAWHQMTPPAVLVVVDRTGADLIATQRGGTQLEVVGGDDDPQLRRSAPGGWSQRRYQQRAEQRWRANAGEVAQRVEELVDELRAGLVVVAGDVRAVQLLVDELPERLRPLVRLASGARGEGSEGHLEDDARRWYRTAVAEHTVALVEEFKEELGQRDRGVAAFGDTIAALRAAAVDTLLVHHDLGDERRLFFAAQQPMFASGDADTVLELGDEYRDGRAVDVLVRAAWAGGSTVRVVPTLPELADGVGATLRYARAGVPDVDG